MREEGMGWEREGVMRVEVEVLGRVVWVGWDGVG